MKIMVNMVGGNPPGVPYCFQHIQSGQLRSDDNFKFTKCYAVG